MNELGLPESGAGNEARGQEEDEAKTKVLIKAQIKLCVYKGKKKKPTKSIHFFSLSML